MRLLCFLLLHLPFCAVAQRADTSSVSQPFLMLKFSMAELIGAQYSKVHGAAAFRIAPRHYTEIGGGKLIDLGVALHRVAWQTFSGYTAEVRYWFFLHPLAKNRRPSVFGFSGGIVHQYLEGSLVGDFNRRQAAYSQRLIYEVKDRRTGGEIGASIFQSMGKHLLLETGLRLRVYEREWTFNELPEDVVFIANGSRHWKYNREPLNGGTEMRGAVVLKVGWLFY